MHIYIYTYACVSINRYIDTSPIATNRVFDFLVQGNHKLQHACALPQPALQNHTCDSCPHCRWVCICLAPPPRSKQNWRCSFGFPLKPSKTRVPSPKQKYDTHTHTRRITWNEKFICSRSTLSPLEKRGFLCLQGQLLVGRARHLAVHCVL